MQGTTCVKYLGMIIDTLDWSSHVQLIKSKLLYDCNMFFKICKFVPRDVLRLLYFCFVHCHLRCCAISWGTANNSVLQPFSVLQNNLLRIMTCSKYRCHITSLCKNLKILKLNSIYQFDLAKFMHKFHHGKLPEIYKEYFQETSSVHSYQTRFANMENYFIHWVSCNSGKKSISYRGASLWNKVEQNLKAVLLSTFCNQLQQLSIK